MKRPLLPLVIALASISLPAAADDVEIPLAGAMSQGDFKKLSEDLSSTLSYKAVSPAEALGTTGFDIGLEVTATKLAHPEVLDQATSSGDDAPSTLIVPKLHVHKGLPFGIDIGAFYAKVPTTNISLVGAEIRYAIVEGGVTTPALGLRGAYSKLSGVDTLDLDTKSVELTISKGFTVLTPYAGVGRVQTTSTPDSSTGLKEEDVTQTKTFIGTNINFAVINIDVEADKTGDATSYGLKVGWRF